MSAQICGHYEQEIERRNLQHKEEKFKYDMTKVNKHVVTYKKQFGFNFWVSWSIWSDLTSVQIPLYEMVSYVH